MEATNSRKDFGLARKMEAGNSPQNYHVAKYELFLFTQFSPLIKSSDFQVHSLRTI